MPRSAEELYDLVSDPHELKNLAGDPKFSGVLGEMREALATWQRETADRVPAKRRPDEFDRESGVRLKNVRRRPKRKKKPR